MCVQNNKKALVLVTVLWVVMLLGVIVAVVGQNCRLDTKICIAATEAVRCKWACRAGRDTAVAVLNEDLRDSDCLTDLWSDNEEDFNDIELERCRVSVTVIDEASKLNINTATKEQLLGLNEMTEEIADAIIDWRDNDDTAGGLGVEGGYYENLPYGYMIRNGPFRTVRELLLVKGVADELFYGARGSIRGRLGYQSLDKYVTSPDELQEEVDLGWLYYLTCYSYEQDIDAEGNRRTNINTADENALVNSLDIKRSIAKWIVENRPNNNYQSIADLINDNSPKQASSSRSDSNEAEPMDLETFSDVADKITVSNTQKIPGRININTALRAVLTAVLGGGDDAERLGDNIIAYRETLDEGMQSIAEVMDAESINIKTFKEIANYITVRSNVYAVYSLATAERSRTDGTVLITETVIDRSSTPYGILYRYEGIKN